MSKINYGKQAARDAMRQSSDVERGRLHSMRKAFWGRTTRVLPEPKTPYKYRTRSKEETNFEQRLWLRKLTTSFKGSITAGEEGDVNNAIKWLLDHTHGVLSRDWRQEFERLEQSLRSR